MWSLAEALRRQLRLNERKNLLHSNAAQALEIEPTFLAALEQAMGAQPLSEKLLEEVVSLAAELLIDRLYAINQYVQVVGTAKDALKDLYRETWKTCLETSDVETALREHHYPRLIWWVGALYPGEIRAALASQEPIGKVVCQNHSAEFQVRLLRLDLRKLRQPLLDIGCGKDALLVRHLRNHNVDAFGLDRRLRHKASFLEERDWLETNYAAGKWGTVVSNMAFTNHFAYALHYDLGQAPRYRTKFEEILESLQEGGSFVYGPSAPDLEREVEARMFDIERWPIGEGFAVTRIMKLGSAARIMGPKEKK